MTAHRKDLELLGLIAVGQPEPIAVADQDLLACLDGGDGEHEQVRHPVCVQSFQQRSVLVCTVQLLSTIKPISGNSDALCG